MKNAETIREKLTVGIAYGVLQPPIEEQVNKQGCTLGKKAKFWEDNRTAINILRFAIDTPDSIHNKLVERLHKRVVKALKIKAAPQEESDKPKQHTTGKETA